jgi:hypothetical protein
VFPLLYPLRLREGRSEEPRLRCGSSALCTQLRSRFLRPLRGLAGWRASLAFVPTASPWAIVYHALRALGKLSVKRRAQRKTIKPRLKPLLLCRLFRSAESALLPRLPFVPQGKKPGAPTEKQLRGCRRLHRGLFGPRLQSAIHGEDPPFANGANSGAPDPVESAASAGHDGQLAGGFNASERHGTQSVQAEAAPLRLGNARAKQTREGTACRAPTDAQAPARPVPLLGKEQLRRFQCGSGAADEDAYYEDGDAADYDLHGGRKQGRVHVAVADEADDGELDGYDDHSHGERDVKIGN